MAKRAGIPWDLILSAELSGHYKPAAEAYLRAVGLLDVPPDRVVMVAAHEMDLEVASEAGLRTAYVHRPQGWRPDESGSTNEPPESTVEIVADDFVASKTMHLIRFYGRVSIYYPRLPTADYCADVSKEVLLVAGSSSDDSCILAVRLHQYTYLKEDKQTPTI